MTDASMTESLDFIERLAEAHCTNCFSIIPRIGVNPEIVRETELVTRTKLNLNPLDLNHTIKSRKTRQKDALKCRVNFYGRRIREH